MPFKSTRQLQTCFGKQISAKSHHKLWTWDCEKWLAETKNPHCLPTKEGRPKKRACRTLRKDEKIIGPVQQGPRGGYFFLVHGVKVYVPQGSAELRWAKRKYGYKSK